MTILGWMMYAVTVGLLLSAAAWLLDRGLVRVALSVRWVWLGSLVLSVGLPFAALPGFQADQNATDESALIGDISPVAAGSPAAGAEGVAQVGWRGRVSDLVGRVFDPAADALNQGVAASAGALTAVIPNPSRLGGWIAVLWASASVVLALVLSWGPARLRRLSRGWPEARAQGRRVRVSPEFGPAAIGVVEPEIVLPRWSLALPAPDLSLVLAHEESHVRARDPLALAVGVLLLVAAPWNPVLWWQLRRLRDAVEVDCDRRVLRGQAGPALYGRILVEVGAHGRMDVLLTPAISGTRSLLERRLDAMKERSRRRELPRTLTASFVALALIMVACNALPPLGPDEPYVVGDSAGSGGVGGSGVDPRPEPGAPGADSTFAVASDPDGGSADDGTAPDPESASTVAPSTTPAPGVAVVPPGPYPAPGGGDGVTPPRTSIPPVGIQGGQRSLGVIGDTIEWIEIPEDPTSQPYFTPYERAPEVTNVEEVRSALVAAYPPVLRDAGIGGTVVLWIYVTDTGDVGNALINELEYSGPLSRAIPPPQLEARRYRSGRSSASGRQ